KALEVPGPAGRLPLPTAEVETNPTQIDRPAIPATRSPSPWIRRLIVGVLACGAVLQGAGRVEAQSRRGGGAGHGPGGAGFHRTPGRHHWRPPGHHPWQRWHHPWHFWRNAQPFWGDPFPVAEADVTPIMLESFGGWTGTVQGDILRGLAAYN